MTDAAGVSHESSPREVLVEACVGSVAEALAAERGGADRLELCDDLSVGGITPSAQLVAEVKSRVRIPVSVMIRPRGGSYVHSASELDHMRRDIDQARALGADMLVVGILDERGLVNSKATADLVRRAGALPVTFHLAFDALEDQRQGLDTLIDAGVSRVLTSGGAPTALEGADALADLVEQAAARIAIMAGGTVRAHNVAAIVARSGVREVHARSLDDETRIRDIKLVLTGA